MLAARHLSAQGSKFIARFEGFRGTPYNDQGNNATIGYGHLIHYGPVTAHDRDVWNPDGIPLTEQDALRLLAHDTDTAAAAIRAAVKVWRQYRFDAFVSLAFNIGAGAFLGSSVLREHRAGHYQAAADAFLRWRFVNGKESEGLLHRRTAERRLYLTGSYT